MATGKKQMNQNNALPDIAAFLKSQDTLTLFCHVRPDGDTLGSAFGLMDLLESLGKRVKVLCADPVSPRYRFLSGGRADLLGTPEGALVCIDIAAPDMAGAYAAFAKQADLVIDHHATNPYFGKWNYIDAAAGATGEILVDLAEELGPLSPRAAAAFYTAIATDTGCFKYGNTTRATHLKAARLMETEFDVAALNRWLFQTKSQAEFEINRLAMETLRFYAGGRIVTMLISREMLLQTAAGADELESISSLPIQIEGAVVAATFKEAEPGQYKVSLRTNGLLDGGKICALFGGGGHRMAAGCSMRGAYETLEACMVKTLRQELEKVQ